MSLQSSSREDLTSQLSADEKTFDDSPLTSRKRAPRRLSLDSDSDHEELGTVLVSSSCITRNAYVHVRPRADM